MDVDSTIERLHALKLNERNRSMQNTINVLSEQYEKMSMEHEKKNHLIAQENVQLRSMMSTLEKQNQMLRNQVAILTEYRTKTEEQTQEIGQLQEEVKALKQTNYSLQYYLQQCDHAMNMKQSPRPPDVF